VHVVGGRRGQNRGVRTGDERWKERNLKRSGVILDLGKGKIKDAVDNLETVSRGDNYTAF
jgi:hypothetical protein